MPKTIIAEGKTSTEAIEKGLKELKATRSQVDVKILEEKKKSFFSILDPHVVKVELTIREDSIPEKKEKNIEKKEINQKDIEEFFHISNPTVTGLLNRMEQKGYVVRVHSPDDKRIRYIQITDKVEDIDKKIKKHIDYSEGVIAKGLSQEERNLLFKLLAKVKDNLIKEEENHVKDID